MIRNIFLSVSLVFTSFLHAAIIEITEIDAMRPYITEEALYLFDIDDTLIDNPFSLGSSPWRNWAKAKLPKLNTSFVLYDALTLHIAKNAPYKPVEPTTPQLIKDLQESGHAVFAFTARGRSQWYTTDIAGVDHFTHQQLNHAGIDFRKTRIPSELKSLEEKYFYEGIIFAEHIKKGDLLKHLLKDLNYHPSVILFADDKLDQVQSVEAALKETGIPFIGFWYRRSEVDRKNFNPQIANIQLEALLLRGELMSDEEASKLLPKDPSDPSIHLKDILQSVDMQKLTPAF
jgi:hypothetical protein